MIIDKKCNVENGEDEVTKIQQLIIERLKQLIRVASPLLLHWLVTKRLVTVFCWVTILAKC